MNIEFPEISKRLLAASGAALIALAALSACGTGETDSGDTSNAADADAEEAAEGEDAPAGGGDGTSPETPLPAGSTLEIADWTVTPEATLDATDAILAADEFNTAPAEGFQQSLVTLEGTYNGTETGSLWLDVTFGVWADGTFYDSIECMNTVENEVTLLPDVSSGGASTGSACVEVPAGADQYLLYFEDILSFDGTQYFVEIG